MLRLYSSLVRKKNAFKPHKQNQVFMYVCGITPYDTTHLGHAFTYVSFDVLVRYLQFQGYKVIYTQNVTDIDDDILRKAKEEKRDWRELGTFWTNRFLEDLKLLNVLPPTYYVKATDSINTIQEIIKKLMQKGYAYENNGNVYFEIAKFKDYGKLSHFNQKQMLLISKERGGDPNDPLKKDPLDFLLWQKSKPDEPLWPFDFTNGKEKGRPGWHIECSAMIKKHLGLQIDIHGGGRDLVFPHHESEIAQSESYSDLKPFVKYWMHTAMVLYEGEKMAKSLGNLVMVKDLLEKYTPNEIRFVLLSHHYRSPWEFDEEELNEARESLKLILKAVKDKINLSDEKTANHMECFKSIMDDDLNTPQALQFIRETSQNVPGIGNFVKKCLSILGFIV